MINENAIKKSFKDARDHANRLEAGIRQNSGLLKDLKSQVLSLTETISELKLKISTGNKGVNQMNERTYERMNEHMNTQINQLNELSNPQEIDKETLTFVKDQFSDLTGLKISLSTLTRQEFNLFLYIYQLEDKGIEPTYTHLKEKFTLTIGCLRGYISSIIGKGAPLIKKRLRDNSIILTIDPGFKSIASIPKLINIYYSQIKQKDASQTTLSNHK